MTKTTLLLAGAALLAANAAQVPSARAQSAKEIYSYKAPSGMFSEGTTKWDMYRLMAIDREQQEAKATAAAAEEAAAARTASAPAPSIAHRTTAHARLRHHH